VIPIDGWRKRTLEAQRVRADEVLRLRKKVAELEAVQEKLYHSSKSVRRFVGLSKYVKRYHDDLAQHERDIGYSTVELMRNEAK
jgi:hypothetical protein